MKSFITKQNFLLSLLAVVVAGLISCDKEDSDPRILMVTWTRIADSYYSGESVEIELESELRCDWEFSIDGKNVISPISNDKILRVQFNTDTLSVGQHTAEYRIRYDGVEKSGARSFFVMEAPKFQNSPQIFEYFPVTKAYKDQIAFIRVTADLDSKITLVIDGIEVESVQSALVYDVSQLSVRTHKIRITAENETGKWEIEFDCEILPSAR